jgi:broad specificity phosphatase PhoE
MSDFQQFIVIRHGESQTNATNTFQAGNQYDSDPLTPLGAEDARRLAERLATLPVDVIISSSYLRARSTAGAIAAVTGAPHVVPVWQGSSWVDLPAGHPDVRNHVSLLREIDVPSELQGQRFDDPQAREIQHAALAVADQPESHYSDEENLYDLWRRAEEIRRHLEVRTERLIVVVAHGGINKLWLAHLMFTAVPGLDTQRSSLRTADLPASAGGTTLESCL